MLQSRRRLALVLTGLVAVAAIACGTDDASSTAAPSTETSAAAASSGAPVTYTLDEIRSNLPLDFDISVYQREDILGGTEVRFSDVVAQGKPVVLNLWAGLCPPCRAEMPDLQEAHEEFGDQVILFGLDVGPFTGLGNEDDALKLIDELGVTYPAGNTDSSRVVIEYRALGMPSTYFIKPDGKVAKSWNGLITGSELRLQIGNLIAAS